MDAARMAELKPQDLRYWRLVAGWGAVDSRMQEFRWLLKSCGQLFQIFAHPSQSVPKNGKAWQQLNS
jgi:ATP-dependent helicase HrpA